MRLTVPCCPFPCFLICLKMALPPKRRVSSLSLWPSCVSLSLVLCPHECCLAPSPSPGSLHDTLHVHPSTLLHPVSTGFCLPPTWALLSFLVWSLCLWIWALSVLYVASLWAHTGRRVTWPRGSQLLSPLKHHLSFRFILLTLCFCGPLRICLSSFKHKFKCQSSIQVQGWWRFSSR